MASENIEATYEWLRKAGFMLRTFKLFWSPEGKHIATVEAKDRKAAIRKAPKPYRKYLGEIYADELIVRRFLRIYSIAWWASGVCTINSQINGTKIGTWEHGAWYGALNGGHEIPDDVRALAMECRPLDNASEKVGAL